MSQIRTYLKEELKKDTGLYALITAFGILNLDVKEPIVVNFIKEKAGENYEEVFKETLIDCIKDPENDMFFRRLGLADYYIQLHTRTNGGGGIDNSDDVLDKYDTYIDAVNDYEHMKKM